MQFSDLPRSGSRRLRLPPRRRSISSSTCRCRTATGRSRCVPPRSSPTRDRAATCRSSTSRRSAARAAARLPRVPLSGSQQPASDRRIPLGSVVGARRRACSSTPARSLREREGPLAPRSRRLVRLRLPPPQQQRLRRAPRSGVQPRRLHSAPEVRTCLLSVSTDPFAARLALAGLARRDRRRRRLARHASTPSSSRRGQRRQGRRFYPDDPIWRDAGYARHPAGRGVRSLEELRVRDETFGETVQSRGPALNVNTLGEVPDSSWFTNRLGRHDMTVDEIVRGPNQVDGPAPGKWHMTGRPDSGITPKFTIRDARGDTYLIKLDPATFPELPSSVEVISTKIFHAIGYHVPEDFIVTFDVSQLDVAPGAKIRTESGDKRPIEMADVEQWLKNTPRTADGRIRALASRYVPGKVVGQYRYTGHAARRSERHLPARAAPRAARDARLRRLAQSRRCAVDQQHRYLCRGQRPPLHPALPAGLRLESRQRQHLGAAAARRQRVPDRRRQDRARG